MSGPGALLVGLAVVMGLNHLVVRTELARRWPPLFWAVVGLDLLVALSALLVGIPGLPSVARLLVALGMMMHVAQDFRARQSWAAEAREAELQREYEEAKRLAEQEAAIRREG